MKNIDLPEESSLKHTTRRGAGASGVTQRMPHLPIPVIYSWAFVFSRPASQNKPRLNTSATQGLPHRPSPHALPPSCEDRNAHQGAAEAAITSTEMALRVILSDSLYEIHKRMTQAMLRHSMTGGLIWGARSPHCYLQVCEAAATPW